VSQPIKYDDEQPLFFHHRGVDIFLHALLKDAAKVLFIEQSGNLSRRGKDTSKQSAKRGGIAPHAGSLHSHNLTAFIKQHGRRGVGIVHQFR
jgi:hypothetical protein